MSKFKVKTLPLSFGFKEDDAVLCTVTGNTYVYTNNTFQLIKEEDGEAAFELDDLITFDQAYVKERLNDLDYYYKAFTEAKELLESLDKSNLFDEDKVEIKKFLYEHTHCY